MAKQSGLGDRLIVGGYDLSGDIGSIQRIAGGPAALDVTDITQSGYGRLGGLRDGGIDFTSWFDKAIGASHPRLSALPTSDVVVTYCRGYGLGSQAASCVGKQIGYDGNRAQDGTFSQVTNVTANGYGVEWGVQLTPGLRVDATGTNGASVDTTLLTAFGAQFYLQVSALTGTSVTVKIQDSADNSTWADLTGATFAAATGPSSERIAVSGTVRRYLRAVSSGTFTSATFLVQGVKNLTAVTF
jgi:hypothetical protein